MARGLKRERGFCAPFAMRVSPTRVLLSAPAPRSLAQPLGAKIAQGHLQAAQGHSNERRVKWKVS
ncbi:MAG: hypothetical protein ACTTIC_04535 [Helicobacteraceae bacterium]